MAKKNNDILNKSLKKGVKKQARKLKKKSPIKFYLMLIIIVVLIVLGFIVYDRFFAKNNPNDTNNNSKSETLSSYEISETTGTIYDEFQIRFLELGNGSSGDSIYIKAGEADILIDGGSEKGSATIIEESLKPYVTDGILEYVIVTHGDSDHISAMVGNKATNLKNFKDEDVERSGILYYYDIGMLIDFAYTNKTTQVMNEYKAARDYVVAKGTNHYTAAECFNQENGAKRHYDLTENISFDILYNKYYFETNSDENNYSVCSMFNYNDLHFCFTGDLEEKGEEAMSAYYDKSTPEKTLPHVKLFKAGHHGSKTSSNECLLSLITPEICVASCTAGGSEYTNININTFPTQEFISRIAKYTDKVYVTTMIDEKESKAQNKVVYKPLNGQICVSSNGTDIGLAFSNNDVKLKDSDWFNETIYLVDGKTCSGKGKNDYYDKDTPGAVATTRRVWEVAS